MRVGDSVKSGSIKGTLIRVQPKTQDAIIRDSDGRIHIRLMSSCEMHDVNEN
jgi:hypothetical protein